MKVGEMEIIYSSVHLIDHANNEIRVFDLDHTNPNLQEYVSLVVYEITTKQNRRKFHFESETSEVRATLNTFAHGEFAEASSINANRLLSAEKKGQERIDRLSKEIQKGSFIQVFIRNDDDFQLLMCKIDHTNILDEIDLTRRAGLPWEKKIFKAVVIEFSQPEIVNMVYIYDSNPRMAEYWWSDFLELTEEYTDSYNTKTAMDMLDFNIFSKIKAQYKQDYIYLRNSSIHYFRSHDEFDVSDYVQEVFSTYIPEDKEFPSKEIIQKVSELPEKKNFDSRFKIIKEDISKKMIQTIKITNQIDLVIKDAIDIKSIIVPDKEPDGRKILKLYTESGYDTFKKD
jgi:hypothetical protein